MAGKAGKADAEGWKMVRKAKRVAGEEFGLNGDRWRGDRGVI